MVAQALLDRVAILLEGKRYLEARQLSRQLLRLDPLHVQLLLFLAQASLHLKDLDTADQACESALSTGSDDPEIRFWKGWVMVEMQKLNKACRWFNECLAAEPNSPRFRSSIAHVYLLLGHNDGARQQALRALRIDPMNQLALSVLSHTDHVVGKHSEALEKNASALRQDPESPDLLTQRGWMVLRAGDYHEAARLFSSVLNRKPDHSTARLGMLEVLKSRYRIFRWYNNSIRSRWFVVAFIRIGAPILILYAFVPESWLSGLSPAQIIALRALMLCILIPLMLLFISPSLSHALLFIHPLGRQSLNRRERLQTGETWVCLALIAFGVALALWLDQKAGWLLGYYAYAWMFLRIQHIRHPTVRFWPAMLASFLISACILIPLSFLSNELYVAFHVTHLLLIMGIVYFQRHLTAD